MKEQLKLCGKFFEIRRNPRRKRIALGIDANENWFIGAPNFYSLKHLEKILYMNKDIAKLINKIEKKADGITPALVFEEGEKLLFRGEKYPLRWTCEPNAQPLELRGSAFYFSSRCRDREVEILELWYSKQLYQILRELVPIWSERLSVSPSKISIKNVTTIWGSCSRKNSITFNVRLALVPPKLLEYVLVHEMLHLKHLNHSAQFWQEMDKHLPDSQERRADLKNNGRFYKWR